jgi:iron complex outermembrane recepter protein
MRYLILSVLFLISGFRLALAQEDYILSDSLWSIDLGEIIVISKPVINHHRQNKPLSTLDEYLERSMRVSMIKRGGYAWEPMVNSLSSERISVTIDGMHIFGACTDKMDPVTSYVDVSNLSEVNILSGQQGAGHGPTIGGAINLNRSRVDYTRTGWSGGVDLGFESNALMQTYGAEAGYTHKHFFVDADFMYRDAHNYKAGKNEEVPFSQFTKYNIAALAGGRWGENNQLDASLIYDKATDVGYPALPMDVSLAEAIISSLRYEKTAPFPHVSNWETRVYFNTITHTMDDTKRPEVPIHMDMPGWSKTYGFYSRLTGSKHKQEWSLNASTYYNQSVAEMTMYPNDPEEALMFMYTWPDVRTQYAGVFGEDGIRWGKGHFTRFTAAVGMHRNDIADDFGLNSLKIFYPELAATKTRVLGSLSAHHSFRKKGFEVNTGIGFGERAPSVSEGYGFYLFNSFDGYDYVGNPNLKNERSLEFSAGGVYKNDHFKVNLSGTFFHMFNYIIGIPVAGLSSMTIGAAGVKQYRALKDANIFNAEAGADYSINDSWNARVALAYSLGKDYNGKALPLIRPFSFRSGLSYRIKGFDTEVSVEGAAKHGLFSPEYGEKEKPAYAILNFAAGYTFLIEQNRFFIKLGVENLLDKKYTTFSDWNNIYRQGRNFYINLSFVLDRKKSE